MRYKVWLLEGLSDQLPPKVIDPPDLEMDVAAGESPFAHLLDQLQRSQPGHWYFVSEPNSDNSRTIVDYPLVVVDEAGAFKWTFGGLLWVTVDDLARAREEGLFKGDPTAVIADWRPYGDGGFPTWAQLFEWLAYYLGLRTFIWTMGSDASFFRRSWQRWRSRKIRRRDVRWLFEFISAHYRTWMAAGAEIPDPWVSSVLRQDVWEASELAARLQVQRGEAARFLRVVGYVETEKDKFVLSWDGKRRLLRDRLLAEFVGVPLEELGGVAD